MLAVLVVLLATFCGSNAFQVADCSKTTAIGTLDLKSMEGKWYELASYGTAFSHVLDRCHATTITAGTDGKSFVMTNDRIIKLINAHVKTKWTVEAKGDALTGDLNLKFRLPFIGPVAVPLKVLGTDDYKNYIIFHACYSFTSIFKSNLGFILTKKRNYEAKELESLYSSIDETLKKNGLSRSQFSLSNQRNCEDKSASPTNADSAVPTENTSTEASQTTAPEASATENTSTDASQTIVPEASTTGTVEEEKTPDTPASSESATAAEQSDDKTTTKPSETTSNENTASDSEKVAASDTVQTGASDTAATAAS